MFRFRKLSVGYHEVVSAIGPCSIPSSVDLLTCDGRIVVVAVAVVGSPFAFFLVVLYADQP